MPDVLHWLGVKHIDNLISMSDMKYDAIVQSGISVTRRYEVSPSGSRLPHERHLAHLACAQIPEDLIPPDSRVEIDAKINAGYFSTTAVVDLGLTAGRLWEDLDH
jgi:GTP cyclohydrolase II